VLSQNGNVFLCKVKFDPADTAADALEEIFVRNPDGSYARYDGDILPLPTVKPEMIVTQPPLYSEK